MGRKWTGASLLLVVLTILLAADLAPGQVFTKTRTIPATRTDSKTMTPPATPTRTKLRTPTRTFSETVEETESLELTPSESISRTTDGCDMSLSSSLTRTTYPYSGFEGAPEDLQLQQINIYEIEAIMFSRGDNVITVALEGGIFNYSAPAEAIVTYTTKSRPMYAALGAVDTIKPTSDYASDQNHGLLGIVRKNRARFILRKQLHLFLIEFLQMQSYRIWADEWIFINFRFDATVPPRCAVTEPIVIHIKAYQRGFWWQVTQFTTFFVMIAGVTAAFVGSSIPTSHHAASLAILASLHFAQEDGTELPLAVHPLQVGLGESKYRFVIACMFCNTLIGTVTLVAQWLMVLYMVSVKAVEVDDARRVVLFPRIFMAVTIHLAPGAWFAIARNFGNQSTLNFLLSFSAFSFFTGIVFYGFHHLFSSTRRMPAMFRKGIPQSTNVLLGVDNQPQYVEQAHNTFLRRQLPSLISFVQGYWESAERTGTYIITHGFTFENYTMRGKSWMGWEAVDFFLTSTLTIFDNYVPALAFFQFGLTLLIKCGMLLLMIHYRPVNAYHSGMILFLLYGAEILAMLALTISSTRKELMAGTRDVQDLACAFGAILLLADVGIAVTKSLYTFYLSKTRTREYNIEDATDTRRVELHEGLLATSSPATEMRERETQLERRNSEWLDDVLREKKRGAASRSAEPAPVLPPIADEAGEEEAVDLRGLQMEATVVMGEESDSGSEDMEQKFENKRQGGHAVSDDVDAAEDEEEKLHSRPPPSQSTLQLAEEILSSRRVQDTKSTNSKKRNADEDSAYDSDGLPVLDHPRHLAQELRASGRGPQREEGESQSADKEETASGDEAEGGEGEEEEIDPVNIFKDREMASAAARARVAAARAPLWGDIASAVTPKRRLPSRQRVKDGDFDVL